MKQKQNEEQPTDWKNIFAHDVTNKGLVSKIYKHQHQNKQPSQQAGRRSKQTFLQRTHTNGQ